jgi:hypothetical protein
MIFNKIFFKNNFTRINHFMFIQHKSHLKPFLSYLPCIVCREYFSIIFNVKKCALYSIKYSRNDPICVVPPKLTKANTLVTVAWCFAQVGSGLLALPSNIRRSWKGLPVTKTYLLQKIVNYCCKKI